MRAARRILSASDQERGGPRGCAGDVARSAAGGTGKMTAIPRTRSTVAISAVAAGSATQVPLSTHSMQACCVCCVALSAALIGERALTSDDGDEWKWGMLATTITICKSSSDIRIRVCVGSGCMVFRKECITTSEQTESCRGFARVCYFSRHHFSQAT